MRILCESCGKKVKDSEERCPICGHVLYQSVFGNISEENESELQNISDYELNKVKTEMQDSEAKMSFYEFCEFAKKEAGILPPILPKSRMMYESLLCRAKKIICAASENEGIICKFFAPKKILLTKFLYSFRSLTSCVWVQTAGHLIRLNQKPKRKAE